MKFLSARTNKRQSPTRNRRRRFETLESRRLLAVVATGFENIDSTDFTIGSGAETARFAGDAFSGTAGIPHLYRTGLFAWMVNEGGTGTLQFSGTADSISMWGRLRNNATTGSLVITAFDVNNQSLGTATFSNPASPFQEVTFSGPVARIDFVNSTDQMISIDDFTADVTALPVNQQPTFTATNPASVLEDSGAHSTAFATFDPGAPSEATQSVVAYSVTGISNPALFLAPPTINTAGTLSFTPADDAFGSSTFVVTVQDDGGTANGGVDTSESQTFTITVDGINEAPTFDLSGELIVNEDAGPQTVAAFADNFDPGPQEDGSSSNSRVLHDEGTGGTDNPLSADNNNPTNLGTLAAGSNLVSGLIEAAKTVGNVDVFTFQIPTGFELAGLFVLNYDYLIPPSNPNERNAFLAIDDSTTFPYNSNELDINLNPNLDETLFLGGTVFGLDDLPGVGGGNILPRAGVITGRGFTGPLPAGVYTIFIQQTGPANTYTLDFSVADLATKQTVSAYTVSNVSNPTLFSAGPAIDVNGALTYTPAANAFGTATFDVLVQDTGGTANGGADTSLVKVGTITVNSVNDAPIITAMDPPTVLEDAGAQTVNGLITSFVGGPADEVSQALLGYSVDSVSNPDLFATLPSIDMLGNLTYTPAADAFGSSTILVTAQDDGGTGNGGTDVSAPLAITITVAGINEEPTFTIGDEVVVREDAGSQTVNGFASGFNPGPKEDGASTNSQVVHDEGPSGTTNPLSTDNDNPTDLGSLAHGSNIVRGHINAAKTVGDVDVFTFAVPAGFQLDGLFVLEYQYVTPPSNPNERNAFLGIDDTDSFPYDTNGLDINQNPNFDETLFIGGTVFGLDDLPSAGSGDILPRAGVITGSKFTPPLPAGTYTFFIQQTGPANTYALDLRVASITKQSVLAYTVTNVSDPSLFAVQPTVDNNGNLKFTPADDANGTATFDLAVQDTGGTTNGGVDTSVVQPGTITINAVNDRPTFSATNPPRILQDSGAQTITGFVEDFDPGPADEADQTLLAYNLTNISNPSLFSVPPAIDNSGTLTYTPAPGEFGTSTFQLQIQDSGGTDNGGVNLSQQQTYTITVIQELLVTWANPADIIVGTPLSDQQLNATANVSGSFVYSPQAGTVLAVGNDQVLRVTFTPDDPFFNAVNKEVEINVVDVPIVDDFGDAPTGFPVLAAEDGARHLVGSLFLGLTVDAEPDGQPSAQADADGSDDDGVRRLTSIVTASGQTTRASLQVTASETGLLDAWVDFNRDGDWSDVGEQIATSTSLVAGSTVLAITVPADSAAGSAAARFRLSTAGGLAVSGWAADGEVEDYLFTIIDAATTPTVDVEVNDAVSIVVENGQVIVRGSSNLFSAPVSQVGILNVQGTAADDTVTLDTRGGNPVPPGGLNLMGNGGKDVLKILGSQAVDLVTLGAIAAQDFDTIDLTDASENVIKLNAAAIRLLSSTNTVSILGGSKDTVNFSDVDIWRMGTLLAEFTNPWQNVVKASDVNNNGEITAGDALRIINELSRREFSSATNQQLAAPLNVTNWPGFYFDQNGDNLATALDALRVINELARIALSREEGELPQALNNDQALREVVEADVVPAVETATAKLRGVATAVTIEYPKRTQYESPVDLEQATSVAAIDLLHASGSSRRDFL
jgi:Dockerin type I domain/GEVED domain/Bacterial Ig domain